MEARSPFHRRTPAPPGARGRLQLPAGGRTGSRWSMPEPQHQVVVEAAARNIYVDAAHQHSKRWRSTRTPARRSDEPLRVAGFGRRPVPSDPLAVGRVGGAPGRSTRTALGRDRGRDLAQEALGPAAPDTRVGFPTIATVDHRERGVAGDRAVRDDAARAVDPRARRARRATDHRGLTSDQGLSAIGIRQAGRVQRTTASRSGPRRAAGTTRRTAGDRPPEVSRCRGWSSSGSGGRTR